MYRIHRAVHWAPLDAYIRSLAPAAWFRPGVGITVTGSGVSQWDDQSGNGRHLLQGTDSARPALQADGSVLFNGTSHYLKCNAFTLVQPTCVLMVLKQVSWTNGDHIFDGNTVASNRAYQSNVTPQIYTSAGLTIGGNGGISVGYVGVLSCCFNGAASYIKTNLAPEVTGNAGTNNMLGFTLGARGDAAAGIFGHIQVYETVIFPIAPSTAQLGRLIAGLMARHGVAG